MPRRRLLALILAFCATGAIAPQTARAGQRWLQNDDFDGRASDPVTVPEIVLGEGYAVRFSAHPDEYPVQLHKLQVVFVGNPLNPGTACALFSLRVYADDGSGFENPGELLYDSDLYEFVFEIAGSAHGMQEIDLSGGDEPAPGFPLTLTGDFRVELRAAGLECVLRQGNRKVPVCYVDSSAQLGRNFLWGSPGAGLPQSWFDAAAIGTQGDFVIRAFVTTSGVAPPPDVVTPDVVAPDAGPTDTGVPGDRDTGAGTPDLGGPPSDGGAGPDGAAPRDAAAGPDLVSPGADTGPAPDTAAPSHDGAVTPGADGPPAADAPGGLAVTAVLPASAPNDRATDVSVLGRGFVPGVMVALDADPLAVTDVRPQRLTVRVPAGLAPGVKTVVVEAPDGTVATLPAAFTVTGPAGTPGPDAGDDPGGAGTGAAAGGCAGAGPGAGSLPLASGLVVLLGLALACRGLCRLRACAGGRAA